MIKNIIISFGLFLFLTTISYGQNSNLQITNICANTWLNPNQIIINYQFEIDKPLAIDSIYILAGSAKGLSDIFKIIGFLKISEDTTSLKFPGSQFKGDLIGNTFNIQLGFTPEEESRIKYFTLYIKDKKQNYTKKLSTEYITKSTSINNKK